MGFKQEIEKCKKKTQDENLTYEEMNKLAKDFIKNSKCKTIGANNAKKKSEK